MKKIADFVEPPHTEDHLGKEGKENDPREAEQEKTVGLLKKCWFCY